MADQETRDLADALGWSKAPEVPDNFFDDEPGTETSAASVIAQATQDEEVAGQGTDPFKGKSEEEIANEIFNDDIEINGNQGQEDIDDEDETGEGDGNEPGDKTTKPQGGVIGALELLKSKGIVDYELEEGEELTEDNAEEILEDAFDGGVEARIEELFEGMPPIFKQMVKYVKDGGDVNTLLASAAKQNGSTINVNMDINKEENQEAVLRETFKADGYDDELIDTQIELLKDSGKMKAMAEKRFNTWKQKEGEAQEKLIQDQAEAKTKEREAVRQNKVKLSTTLTELDKVGDFKLNKLDKKDLPAYIFDKTVKTNSGQQISNFHKDVFEAMGNQTTALQLSILLRNRNKDGSFNMKKIKESLTTEISKDIKNNVRRTNETPSKSIGGKGSQRKELIDFF